MNADNTQLSSAEGWLLPIDHGLLAAVGHRELQHIVHSPKTFTVPLCPSYCDEVFLWNDLLLPVIDLASWLSDGRQVCRNALVGIVAYQIHVPHTARYAALKLDSVPKRLRVYDNQACTLPEEIPAWHEIAVSCFTYQDHGPIPILDLASVFAARSKALLRQAVHRQQDGSSGFHRSTDVGLLADNRL